MRSQVFHTFCELKIVILNNSTLFSASCSNFIYVHVFALLHICECMYVCIIASLVTQKL